MSSTIENISSNIKEAIEPFSSTKMVEGTQDFLQSNGLVAKFAFQHPHCKPLFAVLFVRLNCRYTRFYFG